MSPEIKNALIARFGPGGAADAIAIFATRPKPARVAGQPGEVFAKALHAAQARVREDAGEAWYLMVDLVRYGRIPPSLAIYKTPRGFQVRMRRDQRIPAAHYWPDGVIPPQIELASWPSGPSTSTVAADMWRRMNEAHADASRAQRAFELRWREAKLEEAEAGPGGYLKLKEVQEAKGKVEMLRERIARLDAGA